jgi:hypothetical protein
MGVDLGLDEDSILNLNSNVVTAVKTVRQEVHWRICSQHAALIE